MQNNSQPAQGIIKEKKKVGIGFYFVLAVLIFGVWEIYSTYLSLPKSNQTSNISRLSEVSESQNSVKLSEIVEQKKLKC